MTQQLSAVKLTWEYSDCDPSLDAYADREKVEQIVRGMVGI